LGRKKIFLRGKDFVFIVCLKKIVLVTTKFGGTQKIARRMSRVAAGLCGALLGFSNTSSK